jgi:autotransporter adhesin
MKLAYLTSPLIACALLTACLVPEKFTAKVTVNPDASFSFNFKGTMVHALVAAKVAKGGKLTANEELGLKAEAEKMAKNAEVKTVTYKGDARYELEMQVAKAAGQSFSMDSFSVHSSKDGEILIAGAEMKERDRAALSQIGIKMDGTLEVSLPKNAEIISHNATSTPSFFGLLGGYSWKIGAVSDRPMMKVRIKQ